MTVIDRVIYITNNASTPEEKAQLWKEYQEDYNLNHMDYKSTKGKSGDHDKMSANLGKLASLIKLKGTMRAKV